jgi:hypothetical protein
MIDKLLLISGVANTALGNAQYVGGDAWGLVSILLGFVCLWFYAEPIK